MAFKKTFVLSTEAVNTYGFVVLTAGINIDSAKKNCPCFYDHNTWEVPLGHWENLRKENNQLLGDLVIEGSNEREKQYITKIENGDIKGASIGMDTLQWDLTPQAVLLNGQTKPTLISCDLFEASITPLPGNNNALALKHDGSLITLNSNNHKNIIPNLKNTDMKQIALKIGLAETATENEIVTAINALQLKSQQGEAFQTEMLKDADKDLTDDNKEVFVELSKTNPAKALKFAQLNKKVDDTESTVETTQGKATATVVKDVKVSALLKRSAGDNSQHDNKDGKDTFDYLQKHNSVELSRIKKEDPEKYNQLATDYGNGIRYTGK
ncbi:MAG: HK97 family phage prohead protease [Bacteroidetes bacterium]|nr:HK97 family phage prohead protease [Bacteroidota bacterium]